MVSHAFEERLRSLGGSVVLKEQVGGDTSDFRTLMARAKALRAGALYLPLYGGALQPAIKQARAIRFEGDLLTPDGFVDVDIDATGDASEGLYVTQIWFENAEFKKKYEAAYGYGKISGTNLGYAALAYDAVLLVDAVAQQLILAGEHITAAAVLRRLPNFSFDGVLGTTTIGSNKSVVRREKIL